MSHTETLKMNVTNPEKFVEYMEKHGFELQEQRETELNGVTYKGHVFKKEGYARPIILETSGNVRFDIWNGNWGSAEKLGSAFQEYLADTAIEALEMEGFPLAEQYVDEETGELVLVGESVEGTQEVVL